MDEKRRAELTMNAVIKLRRKCWTMNKNGDGTADRVPTAQEIHDIVDEALRMVLAESGQEGPEKERSEP